MFESGPSDTLPYSTNTPQGTKKRFIRLKRTFRSIVIAIAIGIAIGIAF